MTIFYKVRFKSWHIVPTIILCEHKHRSTDGYNTKKCMKRRKYRKYKKDTLPFKKKSHWLIKYLDDKRLFYCYYNQKSSEFTTFEKCIEFVEKHKENERLENEAKKIQNQESSQHATI
jgi:hypothetical protein